jgi:beta-lactamase class A
MQRDAEKNLPSYILVKLYCDMMAESQNTETNIVCGDC